MPTVSRQVWATADAAGRAVEPAGDHRDADPEASHHRADESRRGAQMAAAFRSTVQGTVSPRAYPAGESGVSVANNRLYDLPRVATVGRLAALASLPNLMLVGCVVVVVWLVFVPLSALLYNAFTEDTGFGPGALSLDNFIEAYSSWHIPGLLWNSVVFALGTALATFVMGALVAWVVERTDAPGASLFHVMSLLSFAVPGLLMAMAWIFVFSPNIGWGNAALKTTFGLSEAPLNIYSMAGMVWALSSHYFPLAYLVLGPALRALDLRMEEAALMAGASYRQVFAKVTLPLLRAAAVRDGHGLLRGPPPHRPAGAHRRVHHRHPGRHHCRAAGVRSGKRAWPRAARDLRARSILLSSRHPARGIFRHGDR
ncbi:MAG: iron ABC transporter permease [Alphaproteobacteria bacterium]|nr:MAG: iron ABC transporter permease [Alphaproteobacteria bacterium]